MIARRLVVTLVALNAILLGVVLFQHGLLLRHGAGGGNLRTRGFLLQPANAGPANAGSTANLMNAIQSYDPLQSPIVQAAEKASPAVVAVGGTVSTVAYADPFFQEFFWPYFGPSRPQRVEVPFVGSGVIIDNQGHIVTNVHVTQEIQSPFVTLSDGRRVAARLLDKDNRVDVALLKADLANLPFLEMGDSDNLAPGEWVLAIGNPFGEAIPDPRPTVTLGVVSALHRNYKATDVEHERIYLDMIQTDAAINPGNSGGALVNIRGQIVGMNTFIVSRGGGSVGIGFAIPINRVKGVVHEILEHGHVRNYAMDFDVADITPQIARQLRLAAGTRGAVVSEIKDPNGAAAKAGFQVGDIIIRADRWPIRTANDLLNYFLSLQVGTQIEFKVSRNGREVTLRYTIVEYRSK